MLKKKMLVTPEFEGPTGRAQHGVSWSLLSTTPLPGLLEKKCSPLLISCEQLLRPFPLSNPSGKADSDRADRGHFILWCIIYRRAVKCNVLFKKSMFPNLIQSQLSTGRDSADQEIAAACCFPVSGCYVRLCVWESHRGTEEERLLQR